jgi:CTP synthase
VATQAHPELSSRPTRPHPLFAGLVKAALDHQQVAGGEQGTAAKANAAQANTAEADAAKSAPVAAGKPSSAATSK